jgi:glycine/D-amino acid oxidase-like deaminating enzyme
MRPPLKNMNHPVQLDLSLPCDDRYDVIVVGGGPAGCTAATAAAREGAKTLLIESSGSLGGSGTNALVPAWCPFSDKEKIIYRGLAEKIFTLAKEQMEHVAPDALDWVPIDPERLKRVYDTVVTEAGADILFHTVLSAVQTHDGSVTSIVTTNKSGLKAWRAKVFIDCTGDADLVAWAGGRFHKGDASGAGLMPATHCFILSNVDEKTYLASPPLHLPVPENPIFRILESGKYPLITDAHCCQNLIGPGTVGFNAGHLFGVDNTDPASTSKALIHGRRLAEQFCAALREFHPAFRHAFLVATGAQVGIRETRRIVGDYTLTLDDYLSRRSFPDEICRNSYYIDIHWAKEEAAKDLDQWEKWEKHTIRYGPGESHGLPYRCLVPADLRNVLVAGRCVSAEKPVQGSIRVMPVCLAMGEAAGLAAAQAATADGDTHRVDTDALRKRLATHGAYLP